MCNPAPRTKPKLLVILGAGSSVELGMPKVEEIDRLMRQWAQQQAENRQLPRQNYFELLWENRRLYAARADEGSREWVNPDYERCLGDMIALLNAVLDEPEADPLEYALFSAEFLGSHGLKRGAETAQAIYDQFAFLFERLAEHFRDRCSDFEHRIRTDCPNITRYQDLFVALAERFELGIYNLNHDTVALKALSRADGSGYFTGFIDGRFSPSSVQRRAEWQFLYHLHGSVHQCFPRPSTTEEALSQTPTAWDDDLFCRRDVVLPLMRPGVWCGNDDRVFVRTSFVAGGGKLGQLQLDPFQTFYSSLARHVHEAEAILIAGYSFGDPHINSVLKNRLWLGARPRPPVMILDHLDPERRRCIPDGDGLINATLLRRNMRDTVAVGCDTRPTSFHTVASLDEGPYAESAADRNLCLWRSGPVAVWFGGFLAAADRKDEIANWLLRHVRGGPKCSRGR